jgi:hypothetical protein
MAIRPSHTTSSVMGSTPVTGSSSRA